MSVTAWTGAFTAAYQDLCSRLDRDEEPWIDPYAAQDPAEFFAVCSELFFDVPDELRAEYPSSTPNLRTFYKQHPAATDR